MKEITCRKCSGSGKLPQYKHVVDGICFQCDGSGVEIVEDDVIDIVKFMKEERKKTKELEKEFDK